MYAHLSARAPVAEMPEGGCRKVVKQTKTRGVLAPPTRRAQSVRYEGR